MRLSELDWGMLVLWGATAAALAVAVRWLWLLPERLASREAALAARVGVLERDLQALQRMLTEKQNEIDTLRERVRQLESDALLVQGRRPGRGRLLVVGLGTDEALEVDLAALRGVAGLQLAVLRNVTRRSLEALLERHRANGAPVRWLHLAVHGSSEGLGFADGMADWVWLSRHLSGVEVLVLAGCGSDGVADRLSVVRERISMRDEIEHGDAAIFARAFWAGMVQDRGALGALQEALERSPAAVGDQVEYHGV